ncbi:MAG: type II secretion system protein [Phycisphaerales bacterium]|nr:type II secretion system protein [Phycisphaerales bacterium]
MNRRRGFTLIEILVVVAIVGVLMSLLLPALAKARKSAQLLQDGNGIREMHRAGKMHAQDSNQGMPTPGKIACLDMDFDGDGAGDQYVPLKGPEDTNQNTTKALHSLMIALEYYQPKLCVSGVEANPAVQVDDDYQYGLYDPANQSFWDQGFDCNITGQGPFPSNISYAHQWFAGKRKATRWQRNTVDSNVVQMGNRGPKDGNIHPDVVDPEEYKNSNTLLMHGSEKDWTGCFVMGDNSTRTENGFYLDGVEYNPRGGFAAKMDNQFFDEDNHSNAFDIEATSNGVWEFSDLNGGDSVLTIQRTNINNFDTRMND